MVLPLLPVIPIIILIFFLLASPYLIFLPNVFEIFENTSAISNLIRSNDVKQINNAITTAGNKGMFTMEKYAEGLIEQGIIDKDDIEGLFEDDEIEDRSEE